MRIIMIESRFGSPNGIQVNEYLKDTSYDVPDSLGAEFIAAGHAKSDEPDAPLTLTWPPTDEQLEEMSFSALGVLLEGRGVALGPLKSVDARVDAIRSMIALDRTVAGLDDTAWPLTFGQIESLSSLDLAAWLTKKGENASLFVSSEDARSKLCELAGAKKPEPQDNTLTWPPTADEIDTMPVSDLSRLLAERAPGFTGDEAASRAKLHELVKPEQKVELPTDEQIDAMGEPTVATLLTARGIDVGPIPTLAEGQAKLKELIAVERTPQE